MSISETRDHLGAPALKIAGFQLWVHGRQFPDADDAYDQDWLTVTAHCGAKGASVWVSGALLQSWHIARFMRQCELVQATLSGSADLGAAEPELFARIAATDQRGHVNLIVEITPDHLQQDHSFRFEGLDQSYLVNLARECAAILQAYPTTLASGPDV